MRIALVACLWVVLVPSWLNAQEDKAAQAPVAVASDADADAAIAVELDGDTYQIVEGDAVAKKQDDAEGKADTGEKPEEVEVDPQIAAFEQQFRPHVQRLVQAELGFLRAASQPSPQEFRNVRKAAQAAGADVLKSLVDQQGPRGRIRGINVFLGGAQRPQVQKDLQESFRDALVEIAKANLSVEAVDRYRRECNQRIQAQKTAGVLSLVAALDDRLYLSEAQRGQLQSELEKGWQDKWQSALTLMVNNPEYFPTVPDALVIPHLSHFQVEVWQGLQKVDYGVNPWMFLGNDFGIDVQEEVEEEDAQEN